MRYGQCVDTEIGKLYLAVEDGCLVEIRRWADEPEGHCLAEQTKYEKEAERCLQVGGIGQSSARINVQDTGSRELQILENAVGQLQEYLAGTRTSFDIPICTNGTAFQRKVWKALCDIPHGETRTYGQIAVAIGNPKASRAVGGACNKNPIMIIVPCHRVIGSNGKLVGFGGGLDMKEWLLSLEGIL